MALTAAERARLLKVSRWRADSAEALERLLDRYPALRKRITNVQVDGAQRVLDAVATMDLTEAWRDYDVRYEPAPTDRDVVDALYQVKIEQDRLDRAEKRVVEMARRRGVTWPHIARALDLRTPQAAQQRYKRMADTLSTIFEPLDPHRGIDGTDDPAAPVDPLVSGA